MLDTDEIRYSFWLEKELEKNVRRLAGNVSRGCKSRHDVQPFSQRMTLKRLNMRWKVFQRWKPSKTKANELSAMTHLNRFRCAVSWKNRLC